MVIDIPIEIPKPPEFHTELEATPTWGSSIIPVQMKHEVLRQPRSGSRASGTQTLCARYMPEMNIQTKRTIGILRRCFRLARVYCAMRSLRLKITSHSEDRNWEQAEIFHSSHPFSAWSLLGGKC